MPLSCSRIVSYSRKRGSCSISPRTSDSFDGSGAVSPKSSSSRSDITDSSEDFFCSSVDIINSFELLNEQRIVARDGDRHDWSDQLLDALIYLHTSERQVVHRDIKPHNLKLTSTGQIALLDFGLAKASSSELSGANSSTSIFGYTRRYSPLEQIQDQGTNPQSDIYALGATLYHLLTGIKPPDALARAAALANSKPDPLARAYDLHPIIGSELSAVVEKA